MLTSETHLTSNMTPARGPELQSPIARDSVKQKIQQSGQQLAAQQAALAKANQLAAQQKTALAAQQAARTEDEVTTAANGAAPGQSLSWVCNRLLRQ